MLCSCILKASTPSVPVSVNDFPRGECLPTKKTKGYPTYTVTQGAETYLLFITLRWTFWGQNKKHRGFLLGWMFSLKVETYYKKLTLHFVHAYFWWPGELIWEGWLTDKCNQDQLNDLQTHLPMEEGPQEGILLKYNRRGRIIQGVAAVPRVWHGPGPGVHMDTSYDIAWVYHKDQERGRGSVRQKEYGRGGWGQGQV